MDDVHPRDKEVLKQKVETLQADLSRRQESYIRRERAFNMRIEELEDEVRSLKVRVITHAHTRSDMTAKCKIKCSRGKVCPLCRL